jgi:hypothetical protein
VYPTIDGLDVDPADAAAAAEVFLRPHEADALRAAADFRDRRHTLQLEQVERLAKALPLPQLSLPFLFTSEIGPREVDTLADALADAVEKL